jgi:hypothetical protein
MQVVQNRLKWPVFMSTVMNLRVSLTRTISWPAAVRNMRRIILDNWLKQLVSINSSDVIERIKEWVCFHLAPLRFPLFHFIPIQKSMQRAEWLNSKIKTAPIHLHTYYQWTELIFGSPVSQGAPAGFDGHRSHLSLRILLFFIIPFS